MEPAADHPTKLLIGGELVAGTGAPVLVENPHEVARGLRESSEELARTMTAEGASTLWFAPCDIDPTRGG